MIRRIRSLGHRGSAALLALLLLCLTLQSTLVFACDLHDLSHTSTQQAAAAGASEEVAAPSDRSQGGSPLQEVLHAAHCCVHVPALPSTAVVAVALAPPQFAVAYGLPSSSDAHPANLLRPPIAA